MLASSNKQQAEIRLTPADLGPLRVRIAVEDGAANVTFQAQHAVTRDAIEAAMPRLREMLAESGLSLGQTSVRDDGVADRQRQSQQASDSTPSSESDSETARSELAVDGRRKAVVANSLIDTFA